MKKVLATLLLTVSMSAHSVEPTFSSEQLDNLHYAYAFGEQYQKSGKFKENPNQKGLGYIMAGLLWQELKNQLLMNIRLLIRRENKIYGINNQKHAN